MRVHSTLQFLLIVQLVVMNYSFRALNVGVRSRTGFGLGKKWMLSNSTHAKNFSISTKEFHNVQEVVGDKDSKFMNLFKHLDSSTKYNGKVPVTAEEKLTFVKEIFEKFYNTKNYLLPKSFVSELLDISMDSFRSLPNVLSIRRQQHDHTLGDVIVFGDLHGQFHDFYHIVKKNINQESLDEENKENLDSNNTLSQHKFFSLQNTFVFNGDIADRGPMGSEIFITLLLLKVVSPNSVFILRGNHETEAMTTAYGFQQEVKKKYGNEISAKFLALFQTFPLGCAIEDRVFVTHGGLGKVTSEMSIAQINELKRFQEPEAGNDQTIAGRTVDSGQTIAELLWSDPRDGFNGFRFNSGRGGGLYFGADITQKFLAKNGFELLVRSHECVDAGITVSHAGQVVTLFSAPNYCGVQQNLGAILRFPGGVVGEGMSGVEVLEKHPLQGEVIQYAAIKHRGH